MWDHVKADLADAWRCLADVGHHLRYATKAVLASVFGRRIPCGIEWRGTFYRVPARPHNKEQSR